MLIVSLVAYEYLAAVAVALLEATHGYHASAICHGLVLPFAWLFLYLERHKRTPGSSSRLRNSMTGLLGLMGLLLIVGIALLFTAHPIRPN